MADILQGELEELPYEDASFDAVTVFNAVQYAADPVAALRELRRVAVSGASVVILAWVPPSAVRSRVLLAALGALMPPPPPGAGGPFALSPPGKLEKLASRAGLIPERADEVLAPFVFPDIDTAVRGALSSRPARKVIDHAGAEAAAEPPGPRSQGAANPTAATDRRTRSGM